MTQHPSPGPGAAATGSDRNDDGPPRRSLERVVAALRTAGCEPTFPARHEVLASCPCPQHRGQDQPTQRVQVWWLGGVTHLDCVVAADSSTDEQPHDPAWVLDLLELTSADLLDEPDTEPAGNVTQLPVHNHDLDTSTDDDVVPDEPPHGQLPRTGPTAPWRYSTGQDGHRRGVYLGYKQGPEWSWAWQAPLPWVWARVLGRDARGKTSRISYRLAMTPRLAEVDDVHLVTHEQVANGEWAQLLDVSLSADSKICNSVAAAIQALSRAPDCPVEESSPRWRDGQLRVPPADVISGGYSDRAPVAEETARAAWRDIAAIAARTPKLALVLGATMAGLYLQPLRQAGHLDLTPFALVLHGTTSEGKSTALETAGAVVGRPKEDVEGSSGVVIPVNYSPQALNQAFAKLRCFPLFRDELFISDKRAQSQVEQMIVQATNGAGRQVGQRSHDPKTLGQWQSTMLLTSNRSIYEYLTDGGVGLLARLIEVASPVTATTADSTRLRELIPSGYGWPLHWLEVSPGVEGVGADYEVALAELDPPRTGGPVEKVARHLALAVAGVARLEALIEDPADAAAHRGGLWAAAMSAAQEQLLEAGSELAEASVLSRLRELVSTLLTTRKRSFPTREHNAAYETACAAGQPFAHPPLDIQGWDLTGDDGQKGDLAILPRALSKAAADAGIENLRQGLKAAKVGGFLVAEDSDSARTAGRLTRQLKMPRSMGGAKLEVYVFRLGDPSADPDHPPGGPAEPPPPGPAPDDPGDGARSVDPEADPRSGSADTPARYDGGTHPDRRTEEVGAYQQSPDLAPPANSENDLPRDRQGEAVRTVRTESASRATREREAATTKGEPGMGLSTLVAHLRSLPEDDPLLHVRRRAVEEHPCTCCGLGCEMRIGGVIVHPNCLRELLLDADDEGDDSLSDLGAVGASAQPTGPAEATSPAPPTADSSEPGATGAAPTTPGQSPTSTPDPAPQAVSERRTDADRTPDTATTRVESSQVQVCTQKTAESSEAPHDALPDGQASAAERTRPAGPSSVRAQPPATSQLPLPSAPGGRRRHAVAVLDVGQVFLPDGQRQEASVPGTDAAQVLQLGEDLRVGHPKVPGMLIMTEDLCVAAGLDVPAPTSVRNDDPQRQKMFAELDRLGQAFLAPALEQGWTVDNPGTLGPITRLRRNGDGGERVLEVALEPYLYLWDQEGKGPVSATLPDMTDPAARWAELARRAGRLVELLGVHWRTSGGLVGAALFDQAQRRREHAGRSGGGVDAAGRNRARVVRFAGPRPDLTGAKPDAWLEPRESFSPVGGLPESVVDEATWAHGFDVRKQFLSASKLKFPYCTDDDPEPTHIDDPELVAAMLGAGEPSKLPWSLVRLTLPAWTEPRLPAPHPDQRTTGPTQLWVTPPTLRLLLEDPDSRHGAGYDLTELAPTEMWQWPEQGTLLAGHWYDTLRDALSASTSDPAVEAMLKNVYTGYFGRMGSPYSANSARPWHHQPLWAEAIRGQSRCEMWRKMHRAAWEHYRWPMFVTNDEVVYLAGGDDAENPESVAPAADNGRIGALRYSRSLRLDDDIKARIRQNGGHLTTVWTADAGSDARRDTAAEQEPPPDMAPPAPAEPSASSSPEGT